MKAATNELRCLAIRQPWAWAIVAGAKDVENRSWKTDYRGPVVIQASSNKVVVNRLAKTHELRPREFAYSALIGVADLVDIVPLSEELEANPWAWGPHCWIFRNARAFHRSIPLKGKLNLYTLTDDAAQKARIEIATATTLKRDEEVRGWLDAMVRCDVAERAEHLFESYIELGDGASAIRLARSRIETARTADTLADFARAQLETDDIAGALLTANAAIDAANTNAHAWDVRSRVYSALADRASFVQRKVYLAHADRDQAKASELDPTDDDDADTGVDRGHREFEPTAELEDYHQSTAKKAEVSGGARKVEKAEAAKTKPAKKANFAYDPKALVFVEKVKNPNPKGDDCHDTIQAILDEVPDTMSELREIIEREWETEDDDFKEWIDGLHKEGVIKLVKDLTEEDRRELRAGGVDV